MEIKCVIVYFAVHNQPTCIMLHMYMNIMNMCSTSFYHMSLICNSCKSIASIHLDHLINLSLVVISGLTPKELCLHLDVAVYYFFLQLYALFPNNLFQYLRHHYGHSAIGEVNKFHESIAVSV